MRSSNNQSTSATRYLYTSLLILVAVLILLASALLDRIDLIFSFALLVGVWLIDAFLKRILGLSNESVFADLSFAAFIFVGSRGIDQAKNYLSKSDVSSPIFLLVFMIILCLLWLGNLHVCHGISEVQAKNPTNHSDLFWLWFFSLLFGSFSILMSLLLQLSKII